MGCPFICMYNHPIVVNTMFQEHPEGTSVNLTSLRTESIRFTLCLPGLLRDQTRPLILNHNHKPPACPIRVTVQNQSLFCLKMDSVVLNRGELLLTLGSLLLIIRWYRDRFHTLVVIISFHQDPSETSVI